ncbi:hypothetical protein ACH4OW_33845 [Streptomyces sp. NPDC017056]|uniref:hypothetical protein n=1 Tax=Streptomyces sp. NPDC017056 TaxID=3364973 RepID=UPI00379B5524
MRNDIPAGPKNGALQVPDAPYENTNTSPPPPAKKKTGWGNLNMAAVGGIALGGLAVLALVIVRGTDDAPFGGDDRPAAAGACAGHRVRGDEVRAQPYVVGASGLPS